MNIMEDMTDQPIDRDRIKDEIILRKIPKKESADEEQPDEVTFPVFMKIVVMYLAES